MKRLNLSLVTLLTMSTFAIGDGDIAPVEPTVEAPVIVADIEKSWKISLGGYFISHDETISSFTLQDILGTNIDLQKDLGFNESSDSVRIHAEYRFNDFHKIEFAYYRIHSDGSTTLTKDIIFDGNTYQAGVYASAHLNLDIYKLNYGYTFYNTEALDIDLRLGIDTIDVDTGINGNVSFNGVTTSGSASNYTVLAPIPVIGLRMDYALTPKIDLYGSIDYFGGITIDKYSGTLSDFIVGGEYKVSDSFGIGLGFNMTDIDLEIEEDEDEYYTLDQELKGVFAYITYSF